MSRYSENEVFRAGDEAARSLDRYTWPPSFYSCNFCKREFKSPQALGGHMNVHRRDRAKLKQNTPWIMLSTKNASISEYQEASMEPISGFKTKGIEETGGCKRRKHEEKPSNSFSEMVKERCDSSQGMDLELRLSLG